MNKKLVSFVLLSILFIPFTASACDDWLAEVVSVQGSAEFSINESNWRDIHLSQQICPESLLRVGPKSRVVLYLSNNTTMRLAENTLVRFPRQEQQDTFWIELKEGIAHFISRIFKKFDARSPFVNAAVSGTEFVLWATSDKAGVTVIEGEVIASNDVGAIVLTQGQTAAAESLDFPIDKLTTLPQEYTQWATYYPPLLTLEILTKEQGFAIRSLPEIKEFLVIQKEDKAIELLLRLDELTDAERLLLSALYLSAGHSQQADSYLKRATAQGTNGLKHSLYAIIYAGENNPAKSLQEAQKAIQAAPTESTSFLALSYAHQANGMISSALDSAEIASELDSDNILAWIRIGETALASGKHEQAKSALEKARQLAPNNAYSLTLAGLVALFENDFDSARTSFQSALKINSSLPMTRLGLGLMYLRLGNAPQGIRQLEYAASLDPTRSTIRSYMGRAYFELHRNDEALTQWQLAKQYDSADPTPYFYTGIHHLFANQPYQALQELHSALDLNEKRAVSRTESLLQSDGATRAAALSRAYNIAGFSQLTQELAASSLQIAPDSADAHRLLADYFSIQPRNEAARISEVHQARAWQGLTAHPIQPQLMASCLGIPEDLGPSRPGLNEYHSLFTQNGFYFSADGLYASDSTWGENIALSAIHDQFAFSIGQFHYETDGFRENSQQEHDIQTAILQWAITPATYLNFQFEQDTRERGDIEQHIFREGSLTLTREFNTTYYQLGLRHDWNDKLRFLVSLSQQDSEELFLDQPQPGLSIEVERNSEPQAAEFMVHYKLSKFTISGGTSYFTSTLENTTDSFFGSSSNEETITYRHYYLISHTQFDSPLNYSFGVAYDDYSDLLTTGDEISPKIGIIYQPSRHFQASAAAFRTLKRNINGNRTLSPTNIVGFNQLYDEGNSVVSDNIGVRVNWNTADFNWSANVLKRNLEVPYQDQILMRTQIADWEETYIDLSLAKFVTPSLSASFHPLFEQYDYDPDFFYNAEIEQIRNISIPLSLSWFPSQVWQISLTGKYFYQTVEGTVLDDFFNPVSTEKTEEFITIDTSALFRLPHRIGELEFGAANILNEKINYEEVNTNQPIIYPKRFVFIRAKLGF